MNKMVEYGLICASKEEKKLMAALQNFMEPTVALDEQEKYIQDILTQMGLEYVTLYEYKDGEERL